MYPVPRDCPKETNWQLTPSDAITLHDIKNFTWATNHICTLDNKHWKSTTTTWPYSDSARHRLVREDRYYGQEDNKLTTTKKRWWGHVMDADDACMLEVL
jgi:hypothetical protein